MGSNRKKLYIIVFSVIIIGCFWAFTAATVITKNFKTEIINNVVGKEELKVRGVFVTETKEGQKYWEIYADEAQMESENRIAILYNPVGNFYDDNNVIMSFKSDKGTYEEETKKITLYENTLIIYKDGTNVTANKFIWAGKDEDIIAQDDVVITRGDGAFVIKGQEAVLSNNMTHFMIKDKTESKVFDADGVKLK